MALYKHDLDVKLQKSEERYRDLVENMTDSLVVLDKDLNHVLANEVAITLSGLDKDTLMNINYKDYRCKEE